MPRRLGVGIQPVRLAVVLVGFWASVTTARAGESNPGSAPPPSEAVPVAVEDRLRSLEAVNEQLLEAVRTLQRQNAEMANRLEQMGTQRQPPVPSPAAPSLDRSLEGGEDSIENPVPTPDRGAGGATPSMAQPDLDSRGGLDRSLEGGEDSTENPVQGAPGTWRDGRVKIGPGFMIESEDEEFQLQFHNQTQLEARFYEQGGMFPAASQFEVPRQRLIFNGRLTRWIEYDTSVEGAYGAYNLLNAFLNFKPSDNLMIKVGRFKVPFLYEYFAISNVDLITPERSLFGINYGLNRMPGGQLWGQFWDKRLDYAVGAFTGPRNQQIDFNSDKDVIAYLNFHPFDTEEAPAWLKHLNVGGSVDGGSQDNPVVPRGLKTSVSQSANPLLDNVAPDWLVFRNDIRERGWRSFWSLHGAYYYKHLSLYGEWSSGFQDYGRLGQDFNTRVPIDSWYLAGGYFLTGEEVTRRTQVKPKRDFNLRRDKFGLGAVELMARYSMLELGQSVFTANLADPADWANRAYATDLGLNWYLNPYIKIYIDWQHSVFNRPVLFAPDRFQQTSDLFWLRFQLYF